MRDAFYLLGHSWGGILASEYAVRRQPKGLKGLILTNSLASYALWVQSNIQLLQGLPPWVMEGIAAGYGDKEKLLPALKELHAKHGCLLRPQPEEFTRTLEGVFADDARTVVPASMYVAYLLIPCVDSIVDIFARFAPDGELSSWSIIDRVHLIAVPALVINGKKDIAQDFVVRPFFEKIQKVKWRTFESSSHTPMWEEREEFNKEVLDFLDMKFQ